MPGTAGVVHALVWRADERAYFRLVQLTGRRDDDQHAPAIHRVERLTAQRVAFEHANLDGRVPGLAFEQVDQGAQVSAADTFQLRFALEGFACGLAAGVMTAEELDILEDNVEQMRRELRAGDFEQANRLDFEFHQRILVASGNQAMCALVTSSAEIFLESQKLPFIRPERAQETWQEHRKILKALARHAAGPAQKAMQQHIRAAALRSGIAFITLGD